MALEFVDLFFYNTNYKGPKRSTQFKNKQH